MTDTPDTDPEALRRRLRDEDLTPSQSEAILAALRRLEREPVPPPGFRGAQPKTKRKLPPVARKLKAGETPAKGSRVPLEEQRRKTLARQHAYQARLKREKGVVQVCVFAPEHRTNDIRLLARLLREDPDMEIDLGGSSEQEPDI
jgi:hypothetical protein